MGLFRAFGILELMNLLLFSEQLLKASIETGSGTWLIGLVPNCIYSIRWACLEPLGIWSFLELDSMLFFEQLLKASIKTGRGAWRIRLVSKGSESQWSFTRNWCHRAVSWIFWTRRRWFIWNCWINHRRFQPWSDESRVVLYGSFPLTVLRDLHFWLKFFCFILIIICPF